MIGRIGLSGPSASAPVPRTMPALGLPDAPEFDRITSNGTPGAPIDWPAPSGVDCAAGPRSRERAPVVLRFAFQRLATDDQKPTALLGGSRELVPEAVVVRAVRGGGRRDGPRHEVHGADDVVGRVHDRLEDV